MKWLIAGGLVVAAASLVTVPVALTDTSSHSPTTTTTVAVAANLASAEQTTTTVDTTTTLASNSALSQRVSQLETNVSQLDKTAVTQSTDTVIPHPVTVPRTTSPPTIAQCDPNIGQNECPPSN